MNVFITGVSKGLGRALLNLLHEDDAVSRIYAISSSDLDLSVYSKLTLFKIDFTTANLVDEFKQVISISVPIHALINNAGFLDNIAFEEVGIASVERALSINFKAPLFLIQHLLPNLIVGKAHVVSIGSMGGFQGSLKFPGLSVYSSTKAGLASLMECLAEEYADKGVSFNCLALGAVNTEMLQRAFPNYTCLMQPDMMAKLILDFTFNWGKVCSGKVFPLSSNNPT